MRGRFFAIIVLLLAGCTLHEPTRVVLPAEPPAAFVAARAADVAAPSLDHWWRAFHDEELNRLMTDLFARNLDLTQGFARLEQVEAVARISNSARMPSLAAGGSVGRSQQPGLADDFTGNSRQLSLAAGFELDLWGKLAARSNAARLDLAATEQELLTLYLGLSARLADLYFLAVEQRAQLALNDNLVASFSDTAERVERRYRRGLAPAIDLYQSRQSLAGARANRALYEAQLAETEHAIGVLLGRYPKPDRDNSLAVLPGAPALFPAGIPAELISRRPDLQAALRRVEAADERVAAAIADRFPSISLSGGFGTLRQDVTGGLIEGDFWNLLGNLALPVVDGGRRRAEVDRNEAVLREAVARYQQLVLAAFQEVEDALANNDATTRRVERLIETAEATGASLRLSTQRYLAGLTDYLPVLTAQRADFETRSRLLASQRQLLADRISLARALGGTWMRDEMEARLQTEKDATQ